MFSMGRSGAYLSLCFWWHLLVCKITFEKLFMDFNENGTRNRSFQLHGDLYHLWIKEFLKDLYSVGDGPYLVYLCTPP